MSEANSFETSIPRREQLMLGRLPDDFLRLSDSPEENMSATNFQPQYQQQSTEKVPRLSITIAQATLNKSYGLTRMDPYVKLRIGFSVLETNTAYNGGKNPVWNKVFQVTMYPGYDSIFIEIYDERSFSLDDKIAWTHIIIPNDVLSSNKVSNEWYPLSGRLGDKKEGLINIVLSHTYASAVHVPYSGFYPGVQMSYPFSDNRFYIVPPSYRYPQVIYQDYPARIPSVQPVPLTYPPGSVVMPQQQQQFQQPSPQQIQQPPSQQFQQPSPQNVEKDIETLKEMFPLLDKSTIETVMANNNNDKETTINQLLSLTS